MNQNGQLGDRVHARSPMAAAVIRQAALLEHFAAPHFRYEFECLRPRDVVAAVELEAAIAAEKGRALSWWQQSELFRRRGDTDILVGFDASRLVALQRELDDLSRDVVWRDGFTNLVVTVGKNDILDKYFAGSAYTAAFYMGLVDGGSSPTYAAGDTMASHSGWTENVGFSNANRITLSFSSASGGSKALSSAATFNINASGTIAGGFFTTNNTKSGTTGTLYSAGSFTGGNRTVTSGDTLNVSATQAV